MKLHSPERLFGLDEEIDRRFPRVRSLRLIKAERYGGWLKRDYWIFNWIKPVNYKILQLQRLK